MMAKEFIYTEEVKGGGVMTANEIRDMARTVLQKCAATLNNAMKHVDSVLDDVVEQLAPLGDRMTPDDVQRALMMRIRQEEPEGTEDPAPPVDTDADAVTFELYSTMKAEDLLPFNDPEADAQRILTAVRRMKKRPGFRRNAFSDTCSVCGRTIYRDMNFCSSCGQAIDWRGDTHDEDG